MMKKNGTASQYLATLSFSLTKLTKSTGKQSPKLFSFLSPVDLFFISKVDGESFICSYFLHCVYTESRHIHLHGEDAVLCTNLVENKQNVHIPRRGKILN